MESAIVVFQLAFSVLNQVRYLINSRKQYQQFCIMRDVLAPDNATVLS